MKYSRQFKFMKLSIYSQNLALLFMPKKVSEGEGEGGHLLVLVT